MVFRSVILALSLAGGPFAAQFPAYSQQYVQRLGGAVVALEQVVSDFDASATAFGLSRDAALDHMRGSAFIAARGADMARTIARYERLERDLEALEGAGPVARVLRIRHLGDAEIAQGTWTAFEPALPLGPASLLFAGAGALSTMAGGGA